MSSSFMVFPHGRAIQVDGLREVLDGLEALDKGLARDVRAMMRAEARPALSDAKGYAMGIADDGTFARSISLRSIDRGVAITSRGDPAGGVKEFANQGAMRLDGSGRRAGVPAGSPPRALLRSALENVDGIAGGIARGIEDAIATALGAR